VDRSLDLEAHVAQTTMRRIAAAAEDSLWRSAIEDAGRAPSTHNTQPWAFRRTEEGLELLADATRALPVLDPDFRQLVISGGAALQHLRVALEARGCGVAIETLPDDTDDPVLARLRLTGPRKVPAHVRAMHEAMWVRHTDCGDYAPERLAAEPFDHLRTLAADEGASLTVVADARRRAALGRLVGRAERDQSARLGVMFELASWLRVAGRHRDDGLQLGVVLEAPGRRAAREERLTAAGPVLGVIATPGDEPHDWLAAGRALSAVLLGATARHLSTSFFDAPVEEEAALRDRVAEIAAVEGRTQLLLRFGHGQGGRESPRRPLEDLLA
jgi:hypothetical protein